MKKDFNHITTLPRKYDIILRSSFADLTLINDFLSNRLPETGSLFTEDMLSDEERKMINTYKKVKICVTALNEIFNAK